jgi:uncharacterized membrane protein
MIRGREVSRVEGFSDAVFGFTLTLIVVSVEVPTDFQGLRATLQGFPAFAATFTTICWVWYEHYLFFRRYPLEDGITIALNCLLLFVVVFYAYPMKFVFTRLIGGTLGMGPPINEGLTFGDAQLLMLAFSLGWVALFSVFTLLHAHALRRRNALGLDRFAIYDARASRTRHLINVGVGAVSTVMIVTVPMRFLGAAGLLYFLLGPLHGAYGYYNGTRRERLERGGV